MQKEQTATATPTIYAVLLIAFSLSRSFNVVLEFDSKLSRAHYVCSFVQRTRMTAASKKNVETGKRREAVECEILNAKII